MDSLLSIQHQRRLIARCRDTPESTAAAIVFTKSLYFEGCSLKQIFDDLGLLLEAARLESLTEIEFLTSLVVTTAAQDDYVATVDDVKGVINKICKALHDEPKMTPSLMYRERAKFFAFSCLSVKSSKPSFGKHLFHTEAVHDPAALAHARTSTIFCRWRDVFVIDFEAAFRAQPHDEQIVNAFTRRPLLKQGENYLLGIHKLADLRRVAVVHGNTRLLFFAIMTLGCFLVNDKAEVFDVASLNMAVKDVGNMPHGQLVARQWRMLHTAALKAMLTWFEERYIDEVAAITKQPGMTILREIVAEIQPRRRVVGRLMQNVMGNVLKSARKREKRVRRKKSVASTQPSPDTTPKDEEPPPEQQSPEEDPESPEEPGPQPSHPTESELTRNTECVVCLEELLGARRALFVCCKTALICVFCAPRLKACPLCYVAIDGWNEPIIIVV